MKISSTVVAGAFLLIAPTAHAQESAPSIVESAPKLATKNGYELLIAAGKLILPGENGNPSTADRNLTSQENLRRQRVAVARNAPALKLLREALQMPIEAPAITSQDDISAAFPHYGLFREMARQLRQESDVRAADGDLVGALDSRLTALELGAAVSRGPIISMLVGAAVQAVARHEFEILAAKLDARQIRAVVPRMKAIAARRATYPENLQVEKALSVRLALLHSKESLEADPARKLGSLNEIRKELKISEAEAREMIALTPETLKEQYSKAFDASIIARSELPYGRSMQFKAPPISNIFVRNLIQPIVDIMGRFNYERNRAADLLLESALELRAIKLETGAYPATFAAPLDPFGGNEPLVYERKGDGYLLYSIGPDGVDDGGRNFDPTRREFDPDTGKIRMIPSRSVQTDSKGDILAPSI